MDARSKCGNGWLHRYQFIKVSKEGVEEQCQICKKVVRFRNDTPNYIYLAYHMRSALSKEHSYFNHEYASKTTTN